MDKTLVKKHLHLKPEEKRHMAKMIDNGASLKDVDSWHQMRFGKKISKPAFYRLKEKSKTILTETDDKNTNKYTRKGEKDLEPFEQHLRIKISEKTESAGSFKWTYELLKTLALNERTKEPFNQSEEIQKMCFSPRFWMKFLRRKKLNFSDRKSDQKRFSESELKKFRATVDRAMMFFPVYTILNTDETGINFLETRGRIICEQGKKLIWKIGI